MKTFWRLRQRASLGNRSRILSGLALLSVALVGLGGRTDVWGQTNRAVSGRTDEPPLLRQLKLRTDALGFDSLLPRSCRESEAFRQSLLKDGKLGARLIGAACESFRTDENIKRFADRGSYDLSRFRLGPDQIVDAIAGTRKLPKAGEIYGAFQGKWYGLWEDNRVDHHWGACVDLSPPAKIDLHPEGILNLVAYQYAWVGDGYGLNHVIRTSDASQQYLLGYVVHVVDENLERESIRRPHVGVFDGPDRLIWITRSEVFFEEMVRGETPEQDRYLITGFRYSADQNVLEANQAFQSVYSRNPDRRLPWRGKDIQIHVTIRNGEQSN